MDRQAKRELLSISPIPYTGEENAFVRAYLRGDILMLHGWRDGKFKGKYLIDRDGRHIAVIDGIQHESKLATMMSGTGTYMYGTWPHNAKASKTDQKIIGIFCGTPGSSIEYAIDRMENERSLYKRSRARFLREQRIEQKMQQFESQEEEILTWYLENIAPEEYAIKHADRTYYCTACGKDHTGDWKHRQSFQCSGKKVTVLTRVKKYKQDDYVTSFTRQPDGSLAERLYYLWISWNTDGKEMNCIETIRYVWKPYKVGQCYYRTSYSGWWDKNPGNLRWARSFLYPKNVQEVLTNSGYEKTQLWDVTGIRLPFNWIMAWNTPVYTQLVLTGLKRLAAEDSKGLSWSVCDSSLNLKGNTPQEILDMDSNSIGRLKQLNGGVTMHEWLKWKMRHPKESLSTKTLLELEKEHITPSKVDTMLKQMSPEQCLNFIKRQRKILNSTGAAPVIGIYEDYLSMAKRMGMDVNDEIVFRPKDLKLRHDQLVDEFNRQKSKIEAQEMNEKWPGAQKVLERIKEIYDYQGNGWQIITPRTLADIVEDSHQLHHCAGASERYYERIQREETYILFLRHDPKKAWYTLEVEPGGTVRQKRSEYNRQPDLDTVNEYLKEWQVAIRKRLKERDKQLAAQSAQQRAEEMEQLRNGTERNHQLLDLLMADLMEAGA